MSKQLILEKKTVKPFRHKEYDWFARLLIQARDNKNMSQGDLAEKLGVKIATVTSWENRETYPDYSTLVKIEEVLGELNNEEGFDMER